MLYITRRTKLKTTEYLQFLAHEAGKVYSRCLVLFKRYLRKKGIWVSKNNMQKLIRNNNLHSQTVQGIIDKFYENIKSWQQLRKLNPSTKLPKSQRWYFLITYKSSAIRLKENKLILSNGKGNDAIILDWEHPKPKIVSISFDGAYYVNAVYSIPIKENTAAKETCGIDLGEIHLAVANVGTKTFILNGRELRSKRRYQNKVKAKFQKKLSKCKKGSRRSKRIHYRKRKILRKLDNQIKDILHKQTTKLVCTLRKENVKTVAIGDVRNLRHNVDYGNHSNQRIHQMLTGKVRFMITYKAHKIGMTVNIIDESYSSQTCPKCLNKHKINDRNYKCLSCGFSFHRDGVGAINIRQKQMYREYVPVVGVMIPPVGFRYIA